MTTNNAQAEKDFIAQQSAKRNKPQGFTSKAKSDRTPQKPDDIETESTAIPAAQQKAVETATESHETIAALQRAGMQTAAAYVQRQTAQRNAVVEQVSDKLAWLTDPGLLEADIMSRTAAKVKQRTNAWGYESSSVNLDELFALPAPSQRLIGEG